MMRLLARWHIWLGWLIGAPLLMWTLTGLVMVARPIKEVCGEHLRQEAAPATLPAGLAAGFQLPPDLRGVEHFTLRMIDGQPVTLTTAGGVTRRYAADGTPLPPVGEAEARRLVARQIVGSGRQTSARLYPADEVPLDFRRELPVWQVALADGTHVYVGQQTGVIEAVRTPFWRLFDMMWGLHIMDLSGREDTHHPLLILFAALAMLGTAIGVALLFRRRKVKR